MNHQPGVSSGQSIGLNYTNKILKNVRGRGCWVGRPGLGQTSSLPGKVATLEGMGRARFITDAGRWFAVQSLARRETWAARHLSNQNFSVFLPCRRTTRRHARKLETISAPFFPGYLFVHLDLSRDRWRSVNGTYGVARLIMNGDLPAPVPKGVVEALLDASDAEGLLHGHTQLRIGQIVRVLEGPFTEFVGQLDRLDDGDRVRVLLDIMGGRVPVILPCDSVEPVSRSLNS